MKSSELVCRALNYEPSGVPAKTQGICALCGNPIAVGELQAPLSLGVGFMDDLSLAARGSQVVCGWCPPLMAVDGLRQSGFGVFSLEGYRPFRKWGDIAAALLDPPEPPFSMTYATANNQHMGWRSPVNLSRDLFYVRVGLRDVKIRRQQLKQAVADCVLLGEAIEARKKTKTDAPAKKTLPNPFISISNDLKDIKHARVKPAVFDLVDTDPELKAAFDRIMSLTLGETWALRFVLTNTDSTTETTTD